MYNIKGERTMTNMIDIPTIGEVLQEEFLEPLNLSQNALALAIGVPSNRINGIINGVRGMTADTDLRLTKYFGLSEGYFLRIQEQLDIANAKKKIGTQLDNIIPLDAYRKKKQQEELEEELLQG